MCQVYNPVIILKLSFQDIHLLMKAALIFPTIVYIQTNLIQHRGSSKIKLISTKACLHPLDWFQNTILESEDLQNPMTQETTVVSCLQFQTYCSLGPKPGFWFRPESDTETGPSGRTTWDGWDKSQPFFTWLLKRKKLYNKLFSQPNSHYLDRQK